MLVGYTVVKLRFSFLKCPSTFTVGSDRAMINIDPHPLYRFVVFKFNYVKIIAPNSSEMTVNGRPHTVTSGNIVSSIKMTK